MEIFLRGASGREALWESSWIRSWGGFVGKVCFRRVRDGGGLVFVKGE